MTALRCLVPLLLSLGQFASGSDQADMVLDNLYVDRYRDKGEAFCIDSVSWGASNIDLPIALLLSPASDTKFTIFGRIPMIVPTKIHFFSERPFCSEQSALIDANPILGITFDASDKFTARVKRDMTEMSTVC